MNWPIWCNVNLKECTPHHSVQFSRSVVSDSLWPHELQHARPLCPSPTPRVHSDSCPLSQRCHLAISSSVVPFSSCPQSLPASGSFPMSQLFAWGGQSTRVSALASFLPKKSQGWSSEWTGWISIGIDYKGIWENFWGWWIRPLSWCVNVFMGVMYIKTHCTVHFKYSMLHINYTSIKLLKWSESRSLSQKSHVWLFAIP